VTLYQHADAVVREAELTLINAKWRVCQEQAVERLADNPGLGCAPLFPLCPVIQIVVCDGRLLGRARLHRSDGRARWIATAAPGALEVGTYRTLRGAALALARHAGAGHRRHVHRLSG
jgi:hypothetical protein